MTETSFLRIPRSSRVACASKFGAILLAGLPVSASFGANFSWQNVTGTFTDATKWFGGVAPTGTDATDILTFGGTTASPYIATSNSATNPFLVNQLVFAGSGTSATVSQTIDGLTPIKLGGINPMIQQNGTGDVSIKAAIQLAGNLTLSGTGVGIQPNETNKVTLDGALSGLGNITKDGSFTFRFGSSTGTAYSQNTWVGGLTINAGTIRFNNNAYTAPTALRGNPVTMNSGTALIITQFKKLVAPNDDPDSSLRMGTLNGTAGTVEGHRETATVGVFDSIDIVISTMDSGTFGGTINNGLIGAGDDNGRLIIRGVGTQTLTGALVIAKDMVIGRGAGLTFAGNATRPGQVTSAAVVIAGGTFTLDNVAVNNPDRLQNGSASQTGLEPIGGGKFSLIGNAGGTTEAIGRLQLASSSASRSGALTINVTTNGGTGTTLNIASYNRANDNPSPNLRPMNTVNFTANEGAGVLGASARIIFNLTAPTLQNGLLGISGSSGNIGWATVNGQDFATHGITGVQAVTSTAAPVGTGTGTATANAFLNSSFSLSNAGGYALNSLKIAPASAGLSLDIASAGSFRSHGILLAGPTDYTISSSSTGGIGTVDGVSPRYFYVQEATLNVSASLNGGNTPVVKSGAGLLNLTSTTNVGITAPLVINEGTVRATPGSSLPGGELRFRGGVLEITGGGTFARQIGGNSGGLNWSGLTGANVAIGEEQGSGGFAAVGADVTVDLLSIANTSQFAWEDTGFINSGHALVFGSTRADARVTWVDNLGLTAIGQVSNYNAREIRVIDNPASIADVAVLTGTITGVVHDDLLKTGSGTLILTSALNDYRGATLVHEGALLVNGIISSSFLANVRNTATLGGSGTVGRVKVEAGGTIAPGNALGNTSVLTTGDMILSAAGAKLAIELGGTTIGGNGVNGYDQIIALGEVVLNGGTLAGALLPGFLADPGTLFFILSNDGADPVQGTFAEGSQVTIGGELFNISYTGDFTGNPLTSTFTGGNDIVLEYVPEPASAALLACGIAALGLTRRRRAIAA